MKKILSVALSTAMAFSMFATVASANTAATPQQAFDALQAKGILQGFPDGQAHLDKDLTRAEFAIIIAKLADLEGVAGTSFRDANYANHWAKAEIEAVYKAGFMQGVGANLFQPSAKVTLQEVATVVSRILKLETPTAVNNNAALWAQGYVQSVINAGLINPAGLDFTAAANRGTVVSLVYAVDQVQSVPVLSNAVVVDASTLTVTLSDGTTHQVKLATPLVANTATNVTFEINGQSYTTSVTYVVTAATKVENATATNYKQLVVNFDGEVEEASATNVGNYTVANIEFASATLSADKKSVTLLLAEGNGTSNRLARQTATNLRVNGVKNATGTQTFDQTVSFSVVDTQLPTISNVTGLGTSAVRVEFSEPVTRATALNVANYRLNGNVFSGTVSYSYPNVVIISTPLTVGAHNISAQGVQDFAGFAAGTAASNFTVAEDTTAPEIVSITAKNLEEVVVTFNEPVRSVTRAYHTSTSRPATVTVSDNKVTLKFSETNRLSQGANTIYLEGVTDYSGNSAARNGNVTPELDTTRPTIASASAKAVGNVTEITVEFSESVLAADIATRSNFVLRKADGNVYTGNGFTSAGNPTTVPSFEVTAAGTSDKRVVLRSVGTTLPAGTYSLHVAGIRDRAAVGNTIIPESVSFTVTQAGAIAVNSAWFNQDTVNNQTVFYVQFDRAFATSGDGNALDRNKYDYLVGGAETSAQAIPFPASANVSVYSANLLQITVPTSDLQPGFAAAAYKGIRVRNVSDLNGNYVIPTRNIAISSQNASYVGLVDNNDKSYSNARNKVFLKYEGTIYNPVKEDFIFVNAGATITPTGVTAAQSGTQTILEFTFAEDTLPYNTSSVKWTTRAQDAIVTTDTYGRKIAEATSPQDVADRIAPKVTGTSVANVTTKAVTVSFTENIVVNWTPAAFKVTVNGNTISGLTASNFTVDNAVLTVQLPASTTLNNNDVVMVEVLNNDTGKFLTDVAGNAFAEGTVVQVSATTPAPAPAPEDGE